MPKTAAASPLADTRRENLRRLIAERGGANAVAKALGYTNASFISQMTGPSPMRDVSEKTCRAFEKKLGLPLGYLDGQNATSGPPMAPGDVPLTVEVINLVGKVLDEEGLSLPPIKFADIVALALTDAVDRGGKPRPEIVKQVARLLK